MDIKKITNNIICVSFNSQFELCDHFLRFQEHYESPKFRNQVFTIGQFRDWYARQYGAFTYHEDWNGMNIPSYVFDAFKSGLFDPLTKKESKLLNLFKDRTDTYYVLGINSTDEEQALDHEICHGLFYTNQDYKEEVLEALKPYDLANLKDWLIEIGYCEEVLDDECHAYISADYDWLVEEKKASNLDLLKDLHDKLIDIKGKYFKEKK